MMSFNKGFFGNDGRKTYSEITVPEGVNKMNLKIQYIQDFTTIY